MAKLNKRARHKRRAERKAREMAKIRRQPPPPLPPPTAAAIAAAAKDLVRVAEITGDLDGYPEGYAVNTIAAIAAAAAACPPDADADELLYHAAANASAALDAAKDYPPDADDALFAGAVAAGAATDAIAAAAAPYSGFAAAAKDALDAAPELECGCCGIQIGPPPW